MRCNGGMERGVLVVLFVCGTAHADSPHKSNTVLRACALLQEFSGEAAERFLTRLTGDRRPAQGVREFDLLSMGGPFEARFSRGNLFISAVAADRAVTEVRLVLRKNLPREVFLSATGIEQTGVWAFNLSSHSGCKLEPYQNAQGEIRGVTVSVP
jgi:hypothetical protein